MDPTELQEKMEFLMKMGIPKKDEITVTHVPQNLRKNGINYQNAKEYKELVTELRTSISQENDKRKANGTRILGNPSMDMKLLQQVAAWGKLANGAYVLLKPQSNGGGPISDPKSPSNWTVMPKTLLTQFFRERPSHFLDNLPADMIHPSVKGKEMGWVDLRYCIKEFCSKNPGFGDRVKKVPLPRALCLSLST